MDQLKTILQNKGIPYEIIPHEKPIRTAQEGAAYFGIEIGQTAPTLVLKSEKGYCALIISGDRGRVNLDEAAELWGYDRLSMATPKEVRNITGYTVGNVCLVLALPCILDRRLFRYPFVYGGTGEPGSTLKLAPGDLEKLNHVVAFWDMP
ncbi:MAG: YbaK/EbsC family protein [Paenibacillaceae bacterium]|nr:YbaK/EbsC family protein [Paenibacillaceae bacterium]